MDFGSVAEARVRISSRKEALALQEIAEQLCTPQYLLILNAINGLTIITFRAPELFNIESDCLIDERTDIWSLGCLLYQKKNRFLIFLLTKTDIL